MSGKRKYVEKTGFESELQAFLEFDHSHDKVQLEKLDLIYSSITFEAVAEQYLSRLVGVRETTKEYYERGMLVLNEYLGQLPIRKITQRVYTEQFLMKTEERFTKKSFRFYHCLFVNVLNFAVLYEYMEKHPFNGFRIRYGRESKTKKAFTYEQIKAIQKEVHLQSVEVKLVFLVLFETGMRIGELLALNWSDWDNERKELSISKTRSGERINPPKTKAGEKDCIYQ